MRHRDFMMGPYSPTQSLIFTAATRRSRRLRLLREPQDQEAIEAVAAPDFESRFIAQMPDPFRSGRDA